MAYSDRSILIEDARASIDQEIKELEESIRALKSRRNRLSYVSRCPPELLSKIFIFCAASSFSNSSLYGLLSWICVTHVCGHWRSVALDCSELWKDIRLSSPQWGEEMLKRSRFCSVAIMADTSYLGQTPERLISLIFDHVARIKSLTFTASGPTMHEHLTQSTCSAPVLESLSLRQLDLPYRRDVFLLPEHFLGGGTPRLQRLELVNCILVWKSAFLRNLTHLKVHNIALSFRPTTAEVIDTLENMPLLETLDLEDCLPRFSDSAVTIPPPTRMVYMRNLSHIRISSTVLECANLLGHLSLPHDVASISLSCRTTQAMGHDFSSVLTPLSSNMNSRENPVHSLVIDTFESTQVHIRCWTGVTPKKYLHSPYITPMIDLIVHWVDYAFDTANAVVEAACASMPLSHLRSLSVSGRCGLKERLWRTIFGKLSKLRFVHVDDESAFSLIGVLMEECTPYEIRSTIQPSSQQNKSTATSMVYFPTLRQLTLQGVHFEAVIHGVEVIERLRDCLMKRHKHHANIRILTLRQCRNFCAELLADADLHIVVDERKLMNTDEASLHCIFGSCGISLDIDSA